MHESQRLPRPADAPPGHATLQEVERWLRLRRTESAYGFDPATGKKIWERHTDGMEVPLTPADRQRLRGMIFTHNHPRGWNYPESDPRRDGSSFSPDDVYSAAVSGMAELRAVTPRYVFSMLPRNHGAWPTPDRIEPMVNLVADRRDREQTLAHLQGMIDPLQSSAEDLHAIWTELAPLMELRYQREATGQ